MAKKHRVNIPVMLAGILFYLTVVTSYLSGGLLARYTTTATSEDSARVIKFGEFSVDSTLPDSMFIPGVNLTENATVNFGGSESATYVFIVVETPGWNVSEDKYTYTEAISGQITWSINTADPKGDPDTTEDDDGSEMPWTYLTQKGYKQVYYTQVKPNTILKKNILKILNENNHTVLVDSQLKRERLNNIATAINEQKFQINITGFVAQAGGFQNVHYAWASVSEAATPSNKNAPEAPDTDLSGMIDTQA